MVEEQPVKKKNNKLINGLIIFAVIAIVLGMVFFSDITELKSIRERIFPPEPAPEPTLSDIQLYKFIDLHTNKSLTAEIWLINLGDETAKDINVFIRSRNQTGAILFNGNITVTTLVLKSNETCSGIYGFSYTNRTTKIYHTIEVEWNSGRYSYQKETLTI